LRLAWTDFVKIMDAGARLVRLASAENGLALIMFSFSSKHSINRNRADASDATPLLVACVDFRKAYDMVRLQSADYVQG
jgi:hypothetical protein